ncbi:hypothetical protein AADG64_22480 [Achromobacter xylosoxidans]|uniref:hypothetical protein n=1 Tax=Alcaligenes xylosoxydans xylosoxydans TaxID=85698 RepID=UPI00336A3EF0
MTQQDDITQRVLTDDEIEALAKKHIAPHADRLDAILPTRVPYQQTDQFRRVKGLIVDVLSKLRAPVSSIREGFELTYAADADDPACASDLSHFTNGWRACLMSQVRAPVADERAALQKLVDLEDMRLRLRALHENGHGTDYDHYHKALPAAWEAARAALASAPVAGEAQAEQFIQAAIDRAPEPLRRLGEYLSRVLDEDQWPTAERMLLGACDAAPRASAEYERGHADGWAAGWDQAIKQPQADKDGECQPCNGMGIVDGVGDRCPACNGEGSTDRQQRAGEVPSDDALAQIGYAAAIAEVGWGEAWADLESDGDTQQEWRAGAKAIRAALSATQAEQGERDA